MRLEKIASGSYRVYYKDKLIGKVVRTRWTSGSATEWKATGIGWYWTMRGYGTRQIAVDNLIRAYKGGLK